MRTKMMKTEQNILTDEKRENVKKLAVNLLDQLVDTLLEDIEKRTLVHCVMQDDEGKELMTVAVGISGGARRLDQFIKCGIDVMGGEVKVAKVGNLENLTERKEKDDDK